MKFIPQILLSSIIVFHTASLLAMEGIALKKGAEALGKELGVFGERTTSSKAPVVATAVTSSPYQVLRLRSRAKIIFTNTFNGV